MSFVIGHLAIKVIALRAGDLWALGANALLEIWPPSAVTLLWPPPIYVDDDTLGTFLKFEPPAGQFGPS